MSSTAPERLNQATAATRHRVVVENQIWDWLEDHEDRMPLHRRLIGLVTLLYFLAALLVLTGVFRSLREEVVVLSALPGFYAILLQGYRAGVRLRRSRVLVHLRLTPTGVGGFESAVVSLLTMRGTMPMLLWLMIVLFGYRHLGDGHGIALIPIAILALFPALGWAFGLSAAIASAGLRLSMGDTFVSTSRSPARRALVRVVGILVLTASVVAAWLAPPLPAALIIHHGGFFALLCLLPRNPLVPPLDEEEIDSHPNPAASRSESPASRARPAA